MAVCPRSGEIINHVGKHLHLDLYGATNLSDAAYIEAACKEASIATGAVILGANFHHFGGNFGVTGVVLLSSSHLSIHTWVEFDLACIDVFVCDGDNPLLAIPVLEERFKPTRIVRNIHTRGMLA